MRSDTVTLWLNSAGRAPKWTNAERLQELKALSRMEKGSQEYRKQVAKICSSNLLLIPSVVKKYVAKRGRSFCKLELTEELLQAGYFGLERAVEKFDVTKGYQFSTYATNWVRQFIMRHTNLIENSVHIPENLLYEVYYFKKNGHYPTHGRYSYSSAKIRNSALKVMDPVRLDSVLTESGEPFHSVVAHKAPSPSPLPGEHTWASRMLDDKIAEAGIFGEAADLVRAYARKGNLITAAGTVGIPQPKARKILRAAIEQLKAIA